MSDTVYIGLNFKIPFVQYFEMCKPLYVPVKQRYCPNSHNVISFRNDKFCPECGEKILTRDEIITNEHILNNVYQTVFSNEFEMVECWYREWFDTELTQYVELMFKIEQFYSDDYIKIIPMEIKIPKHDLIDLVRKYSEQEQIIIYKGY